MEHFQVSNPSLGFIYGLNSLTTFSFLFPEGTSLKSRNLDNIINDLNTFHVFTTSKTQCYKLVLE